MDGCLSLEQMDEEDRSLINRSLTRQTEREREREREEGRGNELPDSSQSPVHCSHLKKEQELREKGLSQANEKKSIISS